MKKTALLAFLLTVFMMAPTALARKPKTIAKPPAPEKINLVWQADVEGPGTKFDQLPKIDGVNIVSPCWFDVATARGLIRNKIPNRDSVKALHSLGYKVWPLITNSFNPDLTHLLINSPEGRENLKINLLSLADKYQFDGYNFDFEKIADQDRAGLTSLFQEIMPVLKARKLTVSIDVTIPSNTPYWSVCYDRKALAKTADYIMLMTYDQYHPAMHQRGSTAALNWVTAKLEETLKEVPANKLILGVPFYSRIWESQGQSSYANGKTIDMATMEDTIVKQKATPIWHPEWGQNYVEFQKNGLIYSFWQENAASLTEKVKLVHKYNLPGIACWRKGFETPDVWPALNAELNK